MEPSEQNRIRAANIRALWEALQAPAWDKDLLINLGKALYARRSLKDIDDRLYSQLIPRLVEIVERLETKLTPATPAISPPIPEVAPGVTEAVRPEPFPTEPSVPTTPPTTRKPDADTPKP